MLSNKKFRALKASFKAMDAAIAASKAQAQAAALSQWYWQANNSWAERSAWEEKAAAASTPTETNRLVGCGPTMLYPEQGWYTLNITQPLAWCEPGKICVVAPGTVLQHKRYINGFRVVSYYAPGTRFREVSKGSPRDEAVWEVLPPV